MKTLGIWGAQQEMLSLCQGSSVALHMTQKTARCLQVQQLQLWDGIEPFL